MYAVLNQTAKDFCAINGRAAWPTRGAADKAMELYRDASNDEFVVVEVTVLPEREVDADAGKDDDIPTGQGWGQGYLGRE
jgi:hypothetical protein